MKPLKLIFWNTVGNKWSQKLVQYHPVCYQSTHLSTEQEGEYLQTHNPGEIYMCVYLSIYIYI